MSWAISLGLAVLLVACSQTTQNAMPITVGTCGAGAYVNEPCVQVTVCTPGTNSCQSIPNILLDTGSYGLRIFASKISVPLPAEADSAGNPIGECTPYIGGTSDWGPVKVADVMLAGDKASSLPIQIIDAGFAQVPADCTNPDLNPANSGYNGILGVGVLVQDCGSNCLSNANNRVYYACAGANCAGTTVQLSQQVTNPIPMLDNDSNGFSITLPLVSSAGSPSVSGVMYLGIGTQANNAPRAVTVFPTDSNGNFVTQFRGQTYSNSFIDSGSNALYFPAAIAGLADCGGSGVGAGFFCPASIQSFSAVQMGATHAPQQSISFEVMNGEAALSSHNLVFVNVAGSSSDGFDWGLPFFLGKTIYESFESQSTPLGNGPFWAY